MPAVGVVPHAQVPAPPPAAEPSTQTSDAGDPGLSEASGTGLLLASLLGMTPENLSRAFGVLGGHGIAVSAAQITITDRAALTAFSRPDPVPDDLS